MCYLFDHYSTILYRVLHVFDVTTIIQGGLASQDNNKNEFFVTYPVLANVIYISAFDVNYSNYIDHDYDTFNYSITEFIRLRTKTSATLLATSTTMGTVQWFSVGIA